MTSKDNDKDILLKENEKINNLNSKIDGVKNTMSQNIDNSLKNIVKLDVLEQQSEDLSQQAAGFRDKSKQLKNKMWWKNMKMKIIVGSFVIVILLIIILVIVGESGGFKK